jgi:very-short-patch-repair endonuclease
MDWEDRLRGFARTQEGLIAKFHLPALGCTSDHWWQARRNGRWELLSSRVLSLRGTPESDGQRALAAVLDASPGAVLHGKSALAWWGLRGYDLRVIHLARPRDLSGAPARLGKLHKLRDLRPHDVVVVRGVPTETPLRAIWTEAARYASEPLVEIGLRRIGRLLDDAHVASLVTWAALHEIVNDIRERGRSGTTIMKLLAEERTPGSSPAESRTEERLEKILANSGTDPLRRQPVLGGHRMIGRIDYRDHDLPLAVEVNSLTYHSSPSDRTADQLRYQRLNDAGFTVVVIWEDDLWSRPNAVAQTIAHARSRARNHQTVVVHSPSCPWPKSHVTLQPPS